MNPLAKLIHSSFGKIIISVLLGLGLASLFRKVCNERNCMVFRPPDMNEIKSNIYKYDKKCYKFNSTIQKCDKSKKIVSFA